MKEYIENITGHLNPENWILLDEIMYEIDVPKGQIIQEDNKICKNIWYLKEGAARTFEYKEGEEHTTNFFIAPSVFTIFHSLITKSPSELLIRSEENCILNVLPYEKLTSLYEKSHQIEHIGRIMAELEFVAEFNRRRMLLKMDALQRYEYLERNSPEVFQRYQLKDIATYLGITPVSLSRLRKSRFSGN